MAQACDWLREVLIRVKLNFECESDKFGLILDDELKKSLNVILDIALITNKTNSNHCSIRLSLRPWLLSRLSAHENMFAVCNLIANLRVIRMADELIITISVLLEIPCDRLNQSHINQHPFLLRVMIRVKRISSEIQRNLAYVGVFRKRCIDLIGESGQKVGGL